MLDGYSGPQIRFVSPSWAVKDEGAGALRLSQGEREALYEAVIQLIEARLKKAESV